MNVPECVGMLLASLNVFECFFLNVGMFLRFEESR